MKQSETSSLLRVPIAELAAAAYMLQPNKVRLVEIVLLLGFVHTKA